VDKALKHPSFKNVLHIFRESDILIRACKTGNKKVVKWLSTMNINLNVQDEEGMTALMHAVEHYELEKEVELLLKNYNGDIEIADFQGNTALFHALKNTIMFNMIVEKSKALTHINLNNDTILTLCTKLDKYNCFKTIVMSDKEYNPNHCNDEGRTAAMYLVEFGRFKEITMLKSKREDFDINCKNESGESVVSVFIDTYIRDLIGGKVINSVGGVISSDANAPSYKVPLNKNISKYGRTLNTLIYEGADFNVPIDGDGNTALMFFLLIKDYVSAYNLLCYCNTMDLSICNKYGINASYLGSILTEENFKSLDNIKHYILVEINYKLFADCLYSYKTFDYNYLDEKQNNLINYGLVKNNKYSLVILKNMNTKTLDRPNDQGETSLIMASKLGHNGMLFAMLTTHPELNVNCQDKLGNTALHYATMMKNTRAIRILKAYKADVNIANESKLTALDIAKEKGIDDTLNEDALTDEQLKEQMKDIPLFNASQTEIKKIDEDITEFSSYLKQYEYLLKPNFISPYNEPEKVLTIQKLISEGYFDRPGEKGKPDLFDKAFNGIFLTTARNPF